MTIGSDECQCFACKTDQTHEVGRPWGPGTGRSGPFGGPDAVDAFSLSIEQFKKTHPVYVPSEIEVTVASFQRELEIFGDSVKPQGPADIAKEDEPSTDVRAAYPKAAPDHWFVGDCGYEAVMPLQLDSVTGKLGPSGGFAGANIQITMGGEVVFEAEIFVDGSKPGPKTDAVGWPNQPPFFPVKTIITPEAIWQPAPDWPREAYFTDHLGERCFVTMSFMAHRSGLHDEWQAYVGGLPVREKNVECAGRYSTMEDAFAAALSAAQKKASEKFNVPVSEDSRGDSPLVSGPESGRAHPGEAQREEPADELRRYLGRVCPSKKLKGI